MPKSPLLRLASQVFDAPLMIIPEKLEVILRAVGPRLQADATAVQELITAGVLRSQSDADHTAMLKRFAYYDDDEDYGGGGNSGGNSGNRKPYRITDAGIALIPVSGVLMKKGSWMSAMSGCTSYDAITNSFNLAMDDGQVKAVLFDIDSPGGTTHGCFELSDLIYAARGTKPIYSIADDLAASAAYAIASAADKVFITRTAGVGSVGVFCLHIDQSGADAQAGVKYTYIYAGDHKVEGNPHEPLTKGAKSSVQAEVDREYDIFTSTVARNRGVAQADVVGTKADVRFADAALPLLADVIGTFDTCIATLSSTITGVRATIPTSSNKRATGDTPPIMATKLTADELRAKKELAATNLLAAQAAMDECESDADAAPPMCVPCSPPTKKGKKAAAPADTADDNDEDDAPAPKKAAVGVPISAAPTVVAPVADRTADMQEIATLCNLSGFTDLTAGFILSGTSLADVRKTLLDKRAATSAATAVNANFGAVSTDSLDTIEAQANALVTNSGGSLTKSAAYERVLKSNTVAYQSYNDERENAALTTGRVRKYVAAVQPRFAALGLTSDIG